MVFKPHRANRQDWWAVWNGQEHYVGHFKHINWQTMRYEDHGRVDKVITKDNENARALKCRQLLTTTGIILIQHNLKEGWGFAGWHSAWEAPDIQWFKDGMWMQFKLGKRLA